MKATELRIGNYVFDHLGRVQKVAETRSDAYICYLSNGAKLKYKLNTTQPIPLTEEWLLKFGFRDSNGWFGKNGIELFNIRDLYFRGNFPIKSDIKYVHQLQNLYFALTGEELPQVSEGKK